MGILKEQNIYAYNILKAYNCEIDEHYGYLFSSLLHLESELESGSLKQEDFAQRLLQTINGSKAFRDLDRVCLAVTHPGSTRISVLSSFNSECLGENKMSRDYSCFVATTSSIFNTKKSNVRIYSDIQDILTAYSGRPSQRSLKRLADMGVKSGVTIPLAVSNLISGFLFLNSATEGNFEKFESQDYSTLCLMKLVSLSCLNKFLFGKNGIDSRIGSLLAENPQTKNTFDKKEFSQFLTQVLQTRFEQKFSLDIDNQIKKKFLFATNPTAYAIVKTLESVIPMVTNLHIEMKEIEHHGREAVAMILKDVTPSLDQLEALQGLRYFTQQELSVSQGHLVMISTLDECVGVDYSI